MNGNSQFDKKLWPSMIPSFMVLMLLWMIHWAQFLFNYPFYKLGVLPKKWDGLLGIICMPLIHDNQNFHHIINNSIAIFFLLTLLVYSYRTIFLKVFVLSWIMSGALVWIFAENHGAYHIGISAIIYALFGFLFTSGVLRSYFPLQALSLLLVFLYGSMVWGIFPIEEHVSWEGHMAGFLSGIFLSIIYRKEGPQRPKFQYEIEKEMGIEPPDFEGDLRRLEEEREEALKQKQTLEKVQYHYIEKKSITIPDDTPKIT